MGNIMIETFKVSDGVSGCTAVLASGAESVEDAFEKAGIGVDDNRLSVVTYYVENHGVYFMPVDDRVYLKVSRAGYVQ